MVMTWGWSMALGLRMFTTLNDLVDGFKHVLSPIHRHGMHCHKPSMIIPVDFQYVYPRLDDIRLPFDPITHSIWDAPSLIKRHQNLGCVIFFFPSYFSPLLPISQISGHAPFLNSFGDEHPVATLAATCPPRRPPAMRALQRQHAGFGPDAAHG